MVKNFTKEEWIKIGQEMVEKRMKKILKAKNRKFDTVATHGIYDLEEALSLNNGSIMEPTYLSPAQAYNNSAEMAAGLAYEMPTWCYSRIANPTTFFLEETAALLETYGTDIIASCLATSSGMSAIRTATDPFLIADDSLPPMNIVSSSKVYGGTFQQFSIRRFREQGIEVRWVKNSADVNEWKEKMDTGTRFVYGEFPSNPQCEIFDVEKVADLAHKFNCPLIVDSTCASPALLRPITYGADIVVHSASKVMGASGTSIAGLLIARKNIVSKVGSDEMKGDFAIWAKLWPFRDNGPNMHPMAATLILNDLRTLRMKVAQMSTSALEVARWLETQPKIEKVIYPGLASYPEHELAKKYMKLVDSDEHMYGYLLAVVIKEKSSEDTTNCIKFYDNLDMIFRATDLGRVKTIATLNAISTHHQQGEEGRKLASIPPSMVRIAIGVENPADIIADLERGLKAV